MSTSFLRLVAFLFLMGSLCGWAQKSQKPAYSIDLTVTDKDSKEAIIMATIQLQPAGIVSVTNADGRATLHNIEAGTYTLNISYVGYEPRTTSITVNKNLKMACPLTPTTLALREVSVVAKQNASGASTSSIIGRQAIDHLQASSLADIMQLVPGQLMGNVDMTSQANLQIRTLSNNNTAAFGSSVVVDGVPISNNGTVSQGGFSSTAFTGTDLRNIAADDINEVEVVRGIPSAEYGDLTSGMVIVHSKAGVTPWQAKAKINPALMNYSLSKGETLGRSGIINGSFDYAQAWSDPRMKTRSYHRYTGSLGWSYDINKKWNINTKLRYMQAKDWSGDDPDVQADGTYTENKVENLSLTHNGRIQVERFFSRTVNYTIGLTLNSTKGTIDGFTSFSGNMNPILTARETGYYTVPYESRNYRATSYNESKPGNFFAKVSNRFYIKSHKLNQTFKMGAEYHYDWNNGRGYYNADERWPLKPDYGGRPRAYSEVPGLHHVAAYLEDQLAWTINKVNRLRATAGVRFTAMQPFSNVSTTALSPRLNVSFSVTKWLDIRAGIGLNAKTPGLNYLYPDKKYVDRIAAPADPTTGTVAYHTQVYDVQYSHNLKNATTTKVEAGFDIRMKNGKKLSLLGYIDNTPNGYGNAMEYFTYTANYYTPSMESPTSTRNDIVFITTGAVGNTSHSRNRGIEADMDFGTWKALRTSFYLSGAWQESKNWSTDMNSASLKSEYLPQSYKDSETTPFKVVYPNGLDDSYSKYRRLVTTLRTVTHIPELRMVASLTTQFIWHNWNDTYTMGGNPIGWIDTQTNYHPISDDMLAGYLGMDAQYYPTAPTTQKYVGIYQLMERTIHIEKESAPITWNIQARITKELGKIGGLSFYVNNALYYEPYLHGNSRTSTLTQYNTGFSFGAELYFNL